ncbi:MAG: CPBP family intramembrane metalloprotease [Anaerolineae bacterium]|nr:CPBP family intramembrane metalloprotease [Anaerolineae bacterium]MCI0607574.1 CPBP family intramembrane metalloprotease [Anaerolineae bacterium]
MKTIINWRVFFILWIAAILSSIAILPYALELQGSALESMDLPIPLPALIALQIVQSAILFGIIIFAGMFFASRVGLGTPILDSVTRSESASDKVRAILPISIGLGVIASLLIIGMDILIFQPALLKELGDSANTLNLQNAQPAAWKGFLASFYGGITEEILLRLFVMSFLAWLGRFISKTQEGKPTSAVYWIANILAAVLFGLGHLPATAMLIPLTPLVITRAILLNGIGGVIFGWLYWKRGLESAMVAHFSTDIVLHVLLVLITGGLDG